MVKKRRQGDPCVNDSDSSSDDNFKTEKNDSIHKCTHIKRAVDLQKLRRNFKKSSIENEKCSECVKMANGDVAPDADDFEQDLSLWMCLKCGSHLCGRMVNKHALKHYEVSQINLISKFFLF